MQINLDLFPGQGRALSKILSQAHRVDVLMACGVGGGKTHTLSVAATCLAYLNPPNVDGMLLEPTWGMLDTVLRISLEEFWDSQALPYEWNAGLRRYELKHSGNCIWLRSAEKPNHLRGPNLGWVGLDEAAYMRKEVIQICQSRVRHPDAHLRRIFAATTPAGFNWAYDHFADPNRTNRHDTGLVSWPTWENKRVLDADPDFVERMRRSFTPELFQQEVEGAFLTVGAGRTYYQFTRSTHLKAFEYDEALPLDLCVDFNVAPAVWEVAQGSGTTSIPERVIDEICVSGELSTYAALSEFKSRYPQHADGGGVRVFGDATGRGRGTTGISDFEAIRKELPRAQVLIRHKNPLQKDRTNAVNALLKDAAGRVRAYVHPTKCPRLVRDLEQVSNVEGTYQIDKSNKDLTHASDAWGYKVFWCYPILARNLNRPR